MKRGSEERDEGHDQGCFRSSPRTSEEAIGVDACESSVFSCPLSSIIPAGQPLAARQSVQRYDYMTYDAIDCDTNALTIQACRLPYTTGYGLQTIQDQEYLDRGRLLDFRSERVSVLRAGRCTLYERRYLYSVGLFTDYSHFAY